MYEEVLSQLSMPVKFTKDQAYVPSFYEDWIFYQVSFKWWIRNNFEETTFSENFEHNESSLLWPILF